MGGCSNGFSHQKSNRNRDRWLIEKSIRKGVKTSTAELYTGRCMMRKELDLMTRKKLTQIYARRYRTARSKKEKTMILDEFVNLTGYNRSYASWLLRHARRKMRIRARRPAESDQTRDRRLRISRATIDRLLSGSRRLMRLRSRPAPVLPHFV